MSLIPYTNTYVDIDGSIADSDDIVAEFDRVEAFIAAWSDSYQKIGITIVRKHTVPGDGDFDIDPSQGFIQTLNIDAGVTDLNINFLSRSTGDPHRIYVVLRFGSKDTMYTVSGPAATTTVFGVNRQEYMPSQVNKDGKFAGSVIATYGTDALHLQVYADNQETIEVGTDDVLQGISV